MMTPREKFKKAADFTVYYGFGKEAELSHYDVAIVEPQGQNHQSIKKLKEKNTLVIAYISVVEIHKNASLYKLLREEDFLKINNEYIKNEQYDTYLVDIRSKRWNSLLIHQIGNLILHHQYDGIFLDTISDIEYESIPIQTQYHLINAAVHLLENIRNVFEDIIIIQNNGLDKLISHTSKYIDGVCWENPPFNQHSNDQWIDITINNLRYISEMEDIKVLLLLEEKSLESNQRNSIQAAGETAQKHSFLIYQTTDYLLVGEAEKYKCSNL